MNFCPECGALLQVAKKGITLRCPKCKYQKPTEKQEVIQKANIHSGKPIEIVVIDRKTASLRQLSTVKIVCPVCGHTESETWTVETANEMIHSTITFFRCTSCGKNEKRSRIIVSSLNLQTAVSI